MEQQTSTGMPSILVVDDSRLMRVAARKILKEHFEIIEAEDGEIAWERIQETTRFAVIMSDLSMPNLGGLGLLDRIRTSTNPYIRELPVVIVTGAEDDTAAKELALERGASDFITKPFDSVQLVARTSAQVKLQRTTRELGATTEALEKQSSLDLLTGLLNQRAFLEHGQQDIAYALRHQSDLGLIRLEVRDFNRIFLRHGKTAAEQVLKDVAGILKEHLRIEDTAARIGMAQFGILLPAATVAGAHSITERFAEKIAALQYAFGNAGFNAGISCLTLTSSPSWDYLLEEAEQYLVQARHQDGNAIAFHQGALDAIGATALAAHEPSLATEPDESSPDRGQAASTSPQQAHEPQVVEDLPVCHLLTATAPDHVEAVSVSHTPSLHSALGMIAADEVAALTPHLDTLMKQLLPLLDLWNRNNDSRLSACIETLRDRLEQH